MEYVPNGYPSIVLSPSLERTIPSRASGFMLKLSAKKLNRTMDEGMRGKKKRLSHHYGTDFKQNSEAEVKHYFRIK